MTTPKGFEKYQIGMADWASEFMTSKGKGIPDVTDFSKSELELFNEIFRRFTEISESIDNLELCLGFISARTPRKKGLKLDAYLNYHIAFYLQEIYILKERLKTYATKVLRRRIKLGHRVNRGTYKKLINSVEESLSSIVLIRGSHVHDRPFNDDEMKMLGAYSFLATQKPDDPTWLRYARSEYTGVRQTWVKRLKANQTALVGVLDVFFSFIYLEIFDGGVVVLSNNSSKRTRKKPRAA